ncbi:hypothetical protein MLD38_010887 [Melastoma candidum]|uniref:Uncharacterized protein n=1 Tax=Melastoma candidum TaxID=119954 RepID=A0ACB9R0X6_9MYRT|nr:hypothetical protein MLD38_010887 [Melastoma candidum]
MTLYSCLKMRTLSSFPRRKLPEVTPAEDLVDVESEDSLEVVEKAKKQADEILKVDPHHPVVFREPARKSSTTNHKDADH